MQNETKRYQPKPKAPTQQELEMDAANKRLLQRRAQEIAMRPIPQPTISASRIEADVFEMARNGLMRPEAAEKLVTSLRRVSAKFSKESALDSMEARRIADVQRYNAQRQEQALWDSRIPSQFHKASFDKTPDGNALEIDSRNERAVGYCKRLAAEWTEGHKGLTLAGPTGVGKSYLAIVVMASLIRSQNKPLYARFVTERDLLQYMRRSYNRRQEDAHTPSTGETIEYLVRRPKLLVLDDLGAETSEKGEWAIGQVMDLVEHRDAHRKTTIFTTNLTQPEIERRYGARILSRITGRSPWVTIDGDDWRQQVSAVAEDPFSDPFEDDIENTA